MLSFHYVTLSRIFPYSTVFRLLWVVQRRLFFTDRPNDFLESVVGDLDDLFIGPVLYGMWNENARGLESQGFRLRLGGFNEFGAGDEGARKTAAFQVGNVMHTARRATPSIRQRFNHYIALRADKLL